MSEPQLTEVSITASVGGKVQIIKYDLDSSYFVNESRKYAGFDGWTEEEIQEFVDEKQDELRARVEARGQKEFDERWDQSYLNQE